MVTVEEQRIVALVLIEQEISIDSSATKQSKKRSKTEQIQTENLFKFLHYHNYFNIFPAKILAKIIIPVQRFDANVCQHESLLFN